MLQVTLLEVLHESAVTVTGYQGVAWDWKVDDGSTQTIGDGKAIVIPGPMEITDGTVIVSSTGAGDCIFYEYSYSKYD